MSNKPNHRKNKPKVRSVAMDEATFDRIMESDIGKLVAHEVSEIKSFCENHALDFDDVSKLFDSYAKNSPLDLLSTIRRFRQTLADRYALAQQQGLAMDDKSIGKLILPGDKDFRQNP